MSHKLYQIVKERIGIFRSTSITPKLSYSDRHRGRSRTETPVKHKLLTVLPNSCDRLDASHKLKNCKENAIAL